MTATQPRYLVYTNERLFHVVLQALQAEAELVHADGTQDVTDFALLVIDGRSYGAAEMASLAGAARKMIDAGRPILVLAPTNDHKQALMAAGVLVSYAGIESAAMLVEPRATADGAPARHRGVTEQVFAAPGDIQCGLSETVVDQDGTSTTQTVEATAPHFELGNDPEDYKVFLDRVRTVVATILGGQPLVQAGAMQPPPGVPTDCYVLTDTLVNYSFTCSGSKSNGTDVTPKPQTMTLSGHIQTGVYYDNSNVTPKQWLKVETSGTIFTNGPVKNNTKDQVGWTLETYNVESDRPLAGTYSDGTTIADDSSSPNTANGQSAVTSSTSFSVGLRAGTSGLDADTSYSVSNSTTFVMTDWAVLQSNSSSWLFFQQTPYDGRSTNVDSAISGKGIQEPPNLSLYGSTFDTQTVWVHQPASALGIGLSYAFPIKATYCAYKSGFWGWHATEWWSYGYVSVPIVLDCGAALPTTQTAAA